LTLLLWGTLAMSSMDFIQNLYLIQSNSEQTVPIR
jgi:hypothetical protein